MLLRLAPLYWLLLMVYTIAEIICNGSLDVPWWNALLHYLFLNGFTPELFFSFVGGVGYIGILVIMWLIFPFYLTKIDSLEKSVIYGIVAISGSLLLYRILVCLNGVAFNFPLDQWEPWLWYIWRGMYCYALGCILYYALEYGKEFLKRAQIVCTLFLLSILILRILELGSSYSGFMFTVIWMFIIILNFKKPMIMICNPVLSFFGKYSMEVFVAHLLCECILVTFTGILQQGKLCFFVTWVVTIATAFPLHLFSKKMSFVTRKVEYLLFRAKGLYKV